MRPCRRAARRLSCRARRGGGIGKHARRRLATRSGGSDSAGNCGHRKWSGGDFGHCRGRRVDKDVKPGLPAPDGQIHASTGCVYPKSVQTLFNQFDAKRISWKVYAQDMGNTPDPGERLSVRHPR